MEEAEQGCEINNSLLKDEVLVNTIKKEIYHFVSTYACTP